MSTNKKRPSKLKEKPSDFIDRFLYILNNDLNGIDPLIKSKTITNASNNLHNFIEFLSIGDEVKLLNQNSNIKYASLMSITEEMEGHLSLLSNYIKSENIHHSLEKVEKLFKVKEIIAKSIRQLQEINKKYSNYFYTIWGNANGSDNTITIPLNIGMSNQGRNTSQQQLQGGNESDSSCNNSSMSWKGKSIDTVNKMKMRIRTGSKSPINMRSPGCLYYKPATKANKAQVHSSLFSIEGNIVNQERNNSNNHTYMTINNPPIKSSLTSIDIKKNIKAKRALTPNKKLNKQCRKELNATKKSIDINSIPSSTLLLTDNNKDDSPHFPHFYNDHYNSNSITDYQNQIKLLKKENDKINENLIEEKSINHDLKTELNTLKQQKSTIDFDTDDYNTNTNNTLAIQSNLNDITEMIFNISTMESQLRKNVMSSSLSINNTFNIIDFSMIHHTIKDNLDKISSQILSIKELITSLSSHQFSTHSFNANSNNRNQKDINSLKPSHSEILCQKDIEIQSVKKLNNDLKNQLNASNRTASSSLVTKEEVEKYIMKISDNQGNESIFNKEIKDLKELVSLRDKEINEMKEMYQSDLQNKCLIESIIKTELKTSKNTYDITINNLQETIVKKDKEINDLKSKQSSSELSMINQLKINHQKNMTQLKELYNKTISNKNDFIEELTKQLNDYKYNKQTSTLDQVVESVHQQFKVEDKEDIVAALQKELRILKEELFNKDKTDNDFQSNNDLISNKRINVQSINEIELLNDKIRQITEENISYIAQLDQLKENIINLEANEKNLIEQLDTKDNEVLELTATISQMEKKVEMKEEELQSFTYKHRDNDELYEQMKYRIEELEKENDDLIQRRFIQSITKSIRMTIFVERKVKTLIKEEVSNISIDGIIKDISKYITKENEFTLIKEERMQFFEDDKTRIAYSNKNIQLFIPKIIKPKPKFKGSKYQMMIYGQRKKFDILNVSKSIIDFNIIEEKIKEQDIVIPSINNSLKYEILANSISIPAIVKMKDKLLMNHFDIKINGIKKKCKKKINKIINATNFSLYNIRSHCFSIEKIKKCSNEMEMTINGILVRKKDLFISSRSSLYVRGIEKIFKKLKIDNISQLDYKGIDYSFKRLNICKAHLNQFTIINERNKLKNLGIESLSTVVFTLDSVKNVKSHDISRPIEFFYDYSMKRNNKIKLIRESFNNIDKIAVENAIRFDINHELLKIFVCKDIQTDNQSKTFDSNLFTISNDVDIDYSKPKEIMMLKKNQKGLDMSIEASYSKVILHDAKNVSKNDKRFDFEHFKYTRNIVYDCIASYKKTDPALYQIEEVINEQCLFTNIKPEPLQSIKENVVIHSYMSLNGKINDKLLKPDYIINHEYKAQYSKQDYTLFKPSESSTYQCFSLYNKPIHPIKYLPSSLFTYQCLSKIKEKPKLELSITDLIKYQYLSSFAKHINPIEFQTEEIIHHQCLSSYNRSLKPLEYKSESSLTFQCLGKKKKSTKKAPMKITSSIIHQCLSLYSKPNPKLYKQVETINFTYLGITKSGKSLTHSPISSKHDESNDEDSEYSDDEEYEKLKEDYDSLQSVHTKLKEENEVLSQKLGEIQDLITQEKDEFVGLLRVAFEKLVLEIQISTKAKEYVTAILRMLSYDDNDIVEIYNALGKKKGLFKFLH